MWIGNLSEEAYNEMVSHWLLKTNWFLDGAKYTVSDDQKAKWTQAIVILSGANIQIDDRPGLTDRKCVQLQNN